MAAPVALAKFVHKAQIITSNVHEGQEKRVGSYQTSKDVVRLQHLLRSASNGQARSISSWAPRQPYGALGHAARHQEQGVISFRCIC